MARIKALPIELQQVVEKELGEIQERIPNDLQNLKTLLKQEPHLNARLDDQFLIQYLRRCKYNVQKAKKRIHLYYTLKTKFPEFSNVTDVNDSKFRKMLNYGVGIPLPRPLNENGSRIYFVKYEGDVGKGLVDLDELYATLMAMHEIMIMEDPYACINGIIYILDLQDITTNLAHKVTPEFLFKVVHFLKYSLPFRVRSAYFLNTPQFFRDALDIMMPMLSEKFRKMIKIYDENYEQMYELIPKKYLPKEYGGENGSRRQLLKDYENKWLEYAEYFKENIKYGTNEHLRPGKPIDFKSLYGLGGSVYKLELD